MVDVIALIKQDGREEGKQEGEYQTKIATAQRMLERQMDLQTISDITDLSLEEVAKIAQESKS